METPASSPASAVLDADRFALFPSEAMLAVEREFDEAAKGMPHRALFEIAASLGLDAVHELAPVDGPTAIELPSGRQLVLLAAERRALGVRMQRRGLARGLGEAVGALLRSHPLDALKRFKTR